MADANGSTISGHGRKRQGSNRSNHDDRDSKRLQLDHAEGLPFRFDRSFVHSPVKTPTIESPEVHLASARPRHSPAVESVRTIPLLIDLTKDDEDIVMAPAPEEPPARPSTGRDFSPTKPDVDTTPLASKPGLPETLGVPYDTCFGLIETQSSIGSSIETDSDWLPVKVELSNQGLKILRLGSGNHIGWASSTSSRVISQLAKKTKVVLTATLVVPDNRRQSQYIQATLRIIVYGFMSEKRAVAKILSDGDLYLQHPSLSECNGRVPYFNPQYLLRPGGSMPKLENLVISSQGRSGRGPSDFLAEIEKSRLLQVFESAHDPDATFRIRPSLRLQSSLKEHQISALAMMVEKECGTYDKPTFPSIWEPIGDQNVKTSYRHAVTGERRDRHPTLARGGILADEMGLGKTLSAIALILWHLDFLESSKSESHSRRATLIVTPKSIIPEWNQQFEKHVKPGRIRVRTYHGSNRQQVAKDWHDVDVILTTYDTVRSEKASAGPLFETRWARVILDEAHNIRNRDSKVFRAAEAIIAPCRWCLTGTPIQNCLDDFGALLGFIGVPSFETQTQFNYWIIEPVKKRKDYAFKRLRQLVRATCLRRTKASTANTLKLPKKVEVNEVLDLDPGDRELYDFFKRRAATVARNMERLSSRNGNSKRPKPLGGWGGWSGNILPLVGHLRRICDHGGDLLPAAALRAWRDKDIDSIDWQLMKMASQKCDLCETELEEGNDVVVPVELVCGHIICASCRNVIEDMNGIGSSSASCPKCSGRSPLPAPSQGSTVEQYKPSVKIKALLRNLRNEHSTQQTCEDRIVSKSVVFSCWTRMLDFIQKAFKEDNIGFQRIDGQTTLPGRAAALKAFRDDPDCRVMLASIGSVGEGVNLTVANHVHIMEPQWNPMVEAQAVDRVHRIGQERDVLITRYLIKDSIEFYVRGVQEEKLRLIHQSLSSTELRQRDVDVQRYKKLLESLS
ncbi:SNF2 family N-terminal domain-containing protein [Phialemonium atrogriseum]|uniref:SNF2 family N-terminal domain-containing protein n=1 Tax=Phialemonium atrogriseum TaxID=1093897 RepID=A0AAJ0FE55_9PEZI|nr:SNF2 family N-terminal domain-containing protein [Phialemonium atrogriseum]KAK1765266.1 SNF2 family N-terminal domain-containing protein [Phialemonium atrogriseum]